MGNLSSEFEQYIVYSFRVNGRHGTDGWTDRMYRVMWPPVRGSHDKI